MIMTAAEYEFSPTPARHASSLGGLNQAANITMNNSTKIELSDTSRERLLLSVSNSSHSPQ